MPVVLERYELPERGSFVIEQSVDIQVTAQEARRKVNQWLLMEVSHMMGTEEPALVIGTQNVWRVPVIFTASTKGKIGVVGQIDVDLCSGKMNNTPACKAKIEQYAAELAENLAPFQPLSIHQIPKESIPDDVADIPILDWGEEPEIEEDLGDEQVMSVEKVPELVVA